MCLVYEEGKRRLCLGAGGRKLKEVCVYCPSWVHYYDREVDKNGLAGNRAGNSNLEKLTESVNKLAISVERLTSQQQTTDTRVETLTAEVTEIRDKPGKRWDTAVAAVISALIGAGIALLIK